jgi:hypothetical protein
VTLELRELMGTTNITTVKVKGWVVRDDGAWSVVCHEEGVGAVMGRLVLRNPMAYGWGEAKVQGRSKWKDWRQVSSIAGKDMKEHFQQDVFYTYTLSSEVIEIVSLFSVSLHSLLS